MKVIYERVKLRLPYLTLKGGSCFNTPQVCLAAYRGNFDLGTRGGSLGFRPLISIRRLE